MPTQTSWLHRIFRRAVLMLAVIPLAAAPLLHSNVASAQEGAISGNAQAATATMQPAGSAVPQVYAQPPAISSLNLQAAQAALLRSHRSGPTNLPHAANQAAPGGPGAEVGLPSSDAAAAGPTSFVKGKWKVSVPGGWYSAVAEPSGDNAGLKRFNTGNWFAGFSNDGGTTWNYLDPFTLFGSGFCCDQVAIYDPGRNWWFWLLQYGDHLTLANTKDFSHFCWYNFSPGSLGFTGDLDFNDLAVTTNNVYIVSNVFPAAGGKGSVVARLPIDGMTGCSSISYNYVLRTDSFSWKPVSNGGDVLYWGTDWFGTLGSSFKIFKWQENSGSYNWVDSVLGTTFAFYTRNSGQNCGSPDGVVKNWCQFADSRVLGGALYTRPDGTREIVFSVNAKQGGPFALPYPYTERLHFNEASRAYLYSDRTYSNTIAFQFGSLASDARGHQGATMTYGGGPNDYYPGIFITLIDDVNPTQPWTYNFAVAGGGNGCLNSGLRRWGDYSTVRPYQPVNNAFLAFNYVLTANAGSCGSLAPTDAYEIGFGRIRDGRSTTRWK
jgi:hypothetical protein